MWMKTGGCEIEGWLYIYTVVTLDFSQSICFEMQSEQFRPHYASRVYA